MHVEEGAFVTAGQPLVTFKNTNLELQVIRAEAQLTEQLELLEHDAAAVRADAGCAISAS